MKTEEEVRRALLEDITDLKRDLGLQAALRRIREAAASTGPLTNYAGDSLGEPTRRAAAFDDVSLKTLMNRAWKMARKDLAGLVDYDRLERKRIESKKRKADYERVRRARAKREKERAAKEAR